MRVINGGNFSGAYHAKGKYGVTVANGLLVIDSDTKFISSNFSQPVPHSRVFDIRNGARLILSNCNAVNVTLPDEMRPGDFTGNNAQVVPTETGNPERPTVNLLCECAKCSTYRAALVDAIEPVGPGRPGAWGAGATIIDIKASARERRKDPAKVAADVAAQVAGNAAALARWAV